MVNGSFNVRTSDLRWGLLSNHVKRGSNRVESLIQLAGGDWNWTPLCFSLRQLSNNVNRMEDSSILSTNVTAKETYRTLQPPWACCDIPGDTDVKIIREEGWELLSFMSVVAFKGVIRSRPSGWRKLIPPPPKHTLSTKVSPWLPKLVQSQRFQGATWELLVGIPGIVPLPAPTTFVVRQSILRWLTTELIITKRVLVVQVWLYWNLYLYSIGNQKNLKLHRISPGYS